MGDFKVQINGLGSHHNGIPEDADQILAEAVRKLLDAGIKVDIATFSVGDSHTNLLEVPVLSVVAPPVTEEAPTGVKSGDLGGGSGDDSTKEPAADEASEKAAKEAADKVEAEEKEAAKKALDEKLKSEKSAEKSSAHKK